MARAPGRVLSCRMPADFFEMLDEFCKAQIAVPTQSEAVRGLVRLGFDTWKQQYSTRVVSP